jgi:hypothetical protein
VRNWNDAIAVADQGEPAIKERLCH